MIRDETVEAMCAAFELRTGHGGPDDVAHVLDVIESVIRGDATGAVQMTDERRKDERV